MSEIDPCDVLAKHQHHRGQWGDGSCTSRFGGPEHCLPYLLASDLVVSEAKVAEAWDEGARAATMDYGIGETTNPYRTTSRRG